MPCVDSNNTDHVSTHNIGYRNHDQDRFKESDDGALTNPVLPATATQMRKISIGYAVWNGTRL